MAKKFKIIWSPWIQQWVIYGYPVWITKSELSGARKFVKELNRLNHK